jgi:hypothetical protein
MKKSKSLSIQSIMFDKNMFDCTEARRWLKEHGYVPIKHVHKTKKYLRYRLINPDYLLYYYRTKHISNGIVFIIQVPTGSQNVQ